MLVTMRWFTLALSAADLLELIPYILWKMVTTILRAAGMTWLMLFSNGGMCGIVERSRPGSGWRGSRGSYNISTWVVILKLFKTLARNHHIGLKKYFNPLFIPPVTVTCCSVYFDGWQLRNTAALDDLSHFPGEFGRPTDLISVITVVFFFCCGEKHCQQWPFSPLLQVYYSIIATLTDSYIHHHFSLHIERY